MTARTGIVTATSVSHERATVEEIGAASADSQRAGVDHLLAQPGIAEAFVLQTCNRAEAYVVAESEDRGQEALSTTLADVPESSVRRMGHEESLEHLLRVAAGLESVVLGEDQILGQVRDAYEDARGVGGIGPLLEEGVTKAIHVGERARTETAINEGVLSLASAAVRLAERERGIDGDTALVVGAGEMGTLAAEALASPADRVLIANRTVPHAEHVASTVDAPASAIGMDAIPTALEEAAVVVSATGSPDPVVEQSSFSDAGETFVVDIATPRDVPPAVEVLPNVTVRDLDDLESVTEETQRARRAAAESVETLVEAELDHLLTRYKRKRADDVISTMYESAERIKGRELDTALERLDGLDADQRETVEAMADAIVNQLLAAPTRGLRDAAEEDDWSTIATALGLFDPEFGPEDAIEPPEFVDTPATPESESEPPEFVRDRIED